MPPRTWPLVATLFFTLFFIFGSGYNTASVFFTPIVHTFGWSRARMSTMQTALALASGISAAAAGWILDRVEARVVMAAGAGGAGCGFVLAGLAQTYAAMLTGYLLIGLGIGAATLLPCSLVIANWFDERRGLAMGAVMAGTSIGGMVMTLISDRAISAAGWRAGYFLLAAPVFAVVIPAVLFVVRTRPARGGADGAPEAAGLEIAGALKSRSFWMVCAAVWCFAVAVSGTNLHSVPQLIGAGYAPARAAAAFSIVLALGGIGKLAAGSIADRIGARLALSADLIGMALGTILLLAAARRPGLAGYMIAYGLSFGAPLALLPLLMAEAVGVRRFGSLYGVAGIFHTIGSAIGPVIAGHIFDVYRSYAPAFETFAILLLAGAAASCATAAFSTAALGAGSAAAEA